MLVRLDRIPQLRRALRVDRSGHGAIRGLSVITTGEARGHGFDVHEDAVAQVAKQLDGVPGRWTHGGLSDDGLARHLGHWRGGSVERLTLCRPCGLEYSGAATCTACGSPNELAARAVGDFEFSKSAYSIKPDGLDVSAPEYLMQRAAEDPKSLGISVVAHFALEEVPVEGSDEKRVVGRLKQIPRPLRRADWVADPAANPVGLHAGTGALSALSEEATHQLNRIVARVGREEAHEKALAFLSRFFARTEGHHMEPKAETVTTSFPLPNMTVPNMTAATSSAAPTWSLATSTSTAGNLEAAAAPAPEEPKDEEKPADGETPEKCPECGQAMAALRQELDAAKVLASGALAELEATKKKIVDLEADRAKNLHDRAVERVDSLRERGAKVGELLTQEDRVEIVDALTSTSDREKKLGESLLAKFKAAVELAEGAQGVRKQQNVVKVDLEAERAKEQMLRSQGYEVVKDEHGRVDLAQCKPKKVTKVGQ